MLSRNPSYRRGFALVLSLALTGLVFSLVLGFAAWVQFSARAVRVEKEHARARDLAYVALKEALFELEEHGSRDGCILVDFGEGYLKAFPEGLGMCEHLGGVSHQWQESGGLAAFCEYRLSIYQGGASDSFPVGGILSSPVFTDLREPLDLESRQASLVFGENFGVYGPTWQVLYSYAKVCNALKEGGDLRPQGHGGMWGGASIPLDVSTESFLRTKPRWVIDGVQTERGDPVRFGVHPWLLSVDVSYALEVERSDMYYVPRVKESVRVRLYNPYDASLARAHYEVSVSGGLPEVTARVGLGSSMRVVLKDRWTFSSAFGPGEVREVALPERVVFEFPPILESANKLYVGLGDGVLPSVKASSVSGQTGRSLREAFFNRRQARALREGLKPEVTSKVQFYLDEGIDNASLLQRVQGASFNLFDLSGEGRSAVEKRVWEFPQLSSLAASGLQALFAWNYTANRALPNPGAPLITGAEGAENAPLRHVELPLEIRSRVDLEPSLRGVYGRDSLSLGAGPLSSHWEQALAPVLWDGYFYPLTLEDYVPCERGEQLHFPVDPQRVLLRGAFSINTIEASRWEAFLRERSTTLSPAHAMFLAKALAEVVRERLPVRRMADFWSKEGVFQEAWSRVNLTDINAVKRDICEYLVVRPDTFMVEGYGSIESESGMAEATCEAIVQRLPKDGRPYKIVAFRWVQ